MCHVSTAVSLGKHLVDLHVLGANVGEVHAVEVARVYFKRLPPNRVLAPNHVATVEPPYALVLVELITALLLQTSNLRLHALGSVMSIAHCFSHEVLALN